MDDFLSHEIAAFDGTTYAGLEEVAAAVSPTADALSGLVVLVEVGDVRAKTAASWLLAHFLAAGFPLLPAERRRIIQALGRDAQPVAVAVNLCRAIRWLKTPPDVAEAAASTLEALACAEDRLVRAWAVDGLCALAGRFQALGQRADTALTAAMADAEPAVRARAQHLTQAAAQGTAPPVRTLSR